MPRRPLDPSRVVTLVVRWPWMDGRDRLIVSSAGSVSRGTGTRPYRATVRTYERRPYNDALADGDVPTTSRVGWLPADAGWWMEREGTDGGDTDNAGGWRHVPACAPWPERGMDSIHNGEASAPSGALTRLLDENSKRQRRAPRAGPPLRTYYYLLTAAMFRCPGSPRFP